VPDDTLAGNDARSGRRSSGARWILWLFLIALLGGSAALYYWLKREQPAPPPPVAEAPPPPAPPAAAEPAIKHPIEEAAQPAQEEKPLPELDRSDAAARERLTELVGPKPADQLFNSEALIRNIVVTIDNLPRNKFARRLAPVKPAPGPFMVESAEGGVAIDASNAARYAPQVRLAELIDARKLVGLYVAYYPLFQQAYVELGYPKGYFNDRLVEVIDHLLAAPEAQGPVKLVQPKVLYEYADPRLEALSAGQKILVRVGPENAAKLKAKLREIRREVTGQMPPQ
jgi:hypothetical protein